jgi:hypothetical protein
MALKPMALHRGELSHIPSSSEATYNFSRLVSFINTYLSHTFTFTLYEHKECAGTTQNICSPDN